MTHPFLPTTSIAHAIHGKHLVDDEAAQRTQSSNSLGQTTYSQQYANLLHTLRTYLHMPLYSDDICRCSEARKRSTNIRDHAFCSTRECRKSASDGKNAKKADVGGVVTHRVSWQGAEVGGGSFSVVLLVQVGVADEAVRASFLPSRYPAESLPCTYRPNPVAAGPHKVFGALSKRTTRTNATITTCYVTKNAVANTTGHQTHLVNACRLPTPT